MHLQPNRTPFDSALPAFVFPYAIWTVYVHLVVLVHASFNSLLLGLPLIGAAALAATLGWFRLRDPRAACLPLIADQPRNIREAALGMAAPVARSHQAPLGALALSVLWVGLLSIGMPYPWFWWGSLLAMGASWFLQLRSPMQHKRIAAASRSPWWLVPAVSTAAICITLAANRPAADDAFYLSIPATLLRFPEQPVLLDDTMYRLPGKPLLLPFYRLSNYDVLVGVVAKLTGIEHLTVAYMVLPALFAAIAMLAWIHLLLRICPERWPRVLPILLVCVVALGEASRAYGNFAFVHLFHGKAILATCMVPAIAGAALTYARHGGVRHWLFLAATQVAALGIAASALFVAPAAVALALAGGAGRDSRVALRRFAVGLLPVAYLLFAAWLAGSGTSGAQALARPAPHAMPPVLDLLERTWGTWSTRVLLVAMLAAWAFVRDPSRARYFSAGALFFLAAALNPYTMPYIADHAIGFKTYWRLTWALPLPFFLAVIIDGLFACALSIKPRALALAACSGLAIPMAAFAFSFGTLLCSNGVSLGIPTIKVPPAEFAIAKLVAEQVPESGVVLAPEEVSTWLPSFVVHPATIGVRHMYLSLAFDPEETARRSMLMKYVAGTNRPPGAREWFVESSKRYRLTAVVVARAAPWADEIEEVLLANGWHPSSCGAYELLVPAGRGVAGAASAGCSETTRAR